MPRKDRKKDGLLVSIHTMCRIMTNAEKQAALGLWHSAGIWEKFFMGKCHWNFLGGYLGCVSKSPSPHICWALMALYMFDWLTDFRITSLHM